MSMIKRLLRIALLGIPMLVVCAVLLLATIIMTIFEWLFDCDDLDTYYIWGLVLLPLSFLWYGYRND